jgi:hypothetical protein
LARLDRVCQLRRASFDGGAAMEPKPNPFLIANLLLRGGRDHAFLQVTLATAVVVVLVLFVTAFLLGMCCGRGWG